MPLRLTWLDFGHLDAVAMAPFVEEVGAHRIWIAEHHGAGVVHGDALLMTMAVAGVTSRVRVGPAGVLLRYRAPIAVAGSVRLLASYFPDRIEIGLAAGRADPPAARELLDGRADCTAEGYEARVARTLAFLRNEADVDATPAARAAPVTWLLGKSHRSARMAADRGTAYALSLMHGDAAPDADVLDEYRARFRPSAEVPRPTSVLAVAGACTESDAAAAELRAAFDGGRLPIVVHRPIVGTADRCADELRALADRHGVDEVAFADVSPSIEAARGSLARLAEVLELRAGDPHGDVAPARA